MPRIVPLPWQDFERIVIKAGCVFDRQKGDHLIYKKPDLKRPIVFPADNNVPVFAVKKNLRILGLSRDDYFNLLDRI